MNTLELQDLKMAWLAAQEAGDAQAQQRLLHEHPSQQEALIDFIAAYYATGGAEVIDPATPLLALTKRAYQTAFARVFEPQLAVVTLGELRQSRNLKKLDVARGLRLGVDVWTKFESGAIEVVSLSQRQLERLAQFFQINVDQFSTLLTNSHPATTLNRRQTAQAARKEQGPHKQGLAEAISRSTMSKEDQQFWLE